MIKQSDVGSAKIFQPETARIVYECAIHLSTNSKHDDAKEVANFANDIFNLSNQQVPASSRFPHIIPLPELVRRHIQYSSNMPTTSKQDECKDGEGKTVHSVTSEQLKEMRIRGNDLFNNGSYNDALKMYCDAIDVSKNTAYFDIRLLSNRASVYLKLGQYEEALRDAEEYILQRPKCWRGYARKALALVELEDEQGAYVAASIAYYYERNIFRNFEPLRRKFGSSLEMRLFVCRDISDLSKALWEVRIVNFQRNLSGNNSEDSPVIVLENRDYLVSSRTIDPNLFAHDGEALYITNCVLVGTGDECSLTFDNNHHVVVGKVFIAYNVSFKSRFAKCNFLPDSVVKLTLCSFESSNHSFCCFGKLKADFCKFRNNTKGGLLIFGEAKIENSEFFGNEVALGVREGGCLRVRKSKMYGNEQGLLIGPHAKECVVEECELYDNLRGGIHVTDCASSVVIKENRIYDNDEPGVGVIDTSNISILANEILSNSDWGMLIVGDCQVFVKGNKIHRNQSGGICLRANCLVEKSAIEYNDISFNSGPGISEDRPLTERRENKFQDNKEERSQSTAQSETKLCYYCKKPEMNIRKCSNCYTAQYCGKQCQKSDWKNHKEVCDRLLSDASIVLNYVREPNTAIQLIPNESNLQNPSSASKYTVVTSKRGPGLQHVGPEYCPRPNTTNRFIVKMSAGSQVNEDVIFPSYEVSVYDRSLTIDGKLTDGHQIYHLVRKHGVTGQLYDFCRKLFMWVKGPEDGKLRVFINEFPPFQHW